MAVSVLMHIHQGTSTVRKCCMPLGHLMVLNSNTTHKFAQSTQKARVAIREKSKMLNVYKGTGNWNSTWIWDCYWAGGIIEHVRKIESQGIAGQRRERKRIEQLQI